MRDEDDIVGRFQEDESKKYEERMRKKNWKSVWTKIQIRKAATSRDRRESC